MKPLYWNVMWGFIKSFQNDKMLSQKCEPLYILIFSSRSIFIPLKEHFLQIAHNYILNIYMYIIYRINFIEFPIKILLQKLEKEWRQHSITFPPKVSEDLK